MAKTFIERGINVVSGGTDDHLFLVSLIGKEYTGKERGRDLPGRYQHHRQQKRRYPATRSPFVTSGFAYQYACYYHSWL